MDVNITEIPNYYAEATYNTGCIDEVQKVVDACSRFQLHVMETYNHRILVAMIILFILILFRLYINANNPEFSKTDMWVKYLDNKLNLVIIVLMFGIITILFLI